MVWLAFMVGMWIAFFAALYADQLDAVRGWVRDLPLLAELGLWLLAFPWLLGTAVWGPRGHRRCAHSSSEHSLSAGR